MSVAAQKIVIVGGGHAAGLLLQTLAKKGVKGGVTLIAEEPHRPYQRPPLSKKYLACEVNRENLYLQNASFFDEHHFDFLSGARATEIDRAAKTVLLHDGRVVPYEKLALCTGARARLLAISGADLDGVHHLRAIDDVDAIKLQFSSVKSLVVIGGGFIGLEVAAVACAMGKEVTIIEMQDRVMPRAVAPLISAHYQKMHEKNGARVLLKTRVDEVIGRDGRVAGVRCGQKTYSADMVIVGIGVIANDSIAKTARLECYDGILVDEYARTSDADIVSAGDCTRHYNPLLDRRLRLESVHNAVEQGKTAAMTLLGQHSAYAQIPWFWSDQYENKLQMTGLSDGFDEEIIRGDPDAGAFSVFYYKSEKLIAVDSVNRPADHLMGRKLLAKSSELSKAQAADPAFNLKHALAVA